MKNPFGIKERKCKESDYRFFRDLIKKTLYDYVTQYFPFNFQHVRDSFKRTKHEMKILIKGKRRIGFYQLTPHGKKLEITRIFLIPSYHGKGIGSWYMKYFETLGYKHLTLEIWDNNPARFLYKKLGYKRVCKKNHKILMEKKLAFPYYKQETDYTCGAASMRMILEAFGIKKSEKKVAKLLGTSPNHGTWFKDFSRVAKRFKLDYIVKENGTTKELKQLLKQGYKIIVCYLDLKDRRGNIDHNSVVKKIDDKNIYFWDPWYGNKHKYRIGHFRKIWRSRERPDKADRWFIAIKK